MPRISAPDPTRSMADPVLLSEFLGGQFAEAAVRTRRVVIHAPSFDLDARLLDHHEQMLIETSSRHRPLKLSTYAFSTGLPGRMKRSCTRSACAQASSLATLGCRPRSHRIAAPNAAMTLSCSNLLGDRNYRRPLRPMHRCVVKYQLDGTCLHVRGILFDVLMTPSSQSLSLRNPGRFSPFRRAPYLGDVVFSSARPTATCPLAGGAGSAMLVSHATTCC